MAALKFLETFELNATRNPHHLWLKKCSSLIDSETGGEYEISQEFYGSGPKMKVSIWSTLNVSEYVFFQSELNEIKLKFKSGSGDSKASAAFFDAIFEDPEAKVTQTEIWNTSKISLFRNCLGQWKAINKPFNYLLSISNEYFCVDILLTSKHE